MKQITETDIEAIVAACRENAGAIAESLNLCFDRRSRVEVGETSFWNPDEAADALDGPGLTVAFKIGGQAVLCLIPESLPLPEWYTDPGEGEESRLQTLALEWSMNMLPGELEADELRSAAAANLKQHVIDARPADWAGLLELLVFEAADSSETAEQAIAADPPTARIFLVAAVDHSPSLATESEPATAKAGSSPSAGVKAPAANQPASRPQIDRHMLELPVTISVRLAEKKIELGQLISITPGGLLTFSKGCESLLDLYVNNHLYGRGEAIKIGEKFGLKVTQVGVKPERKQQLL